MIGEKAVSKFVRRLHAHVNGVVLALTLEQRDFPRMQFADCLYKIRPSPRALRRLVACTFINCLDSETWTAGPIAGKATLLDLMAPMFEEKIPVPYWIAAESFVECNLELSAEVLMYWQSLWP